MRAYLQSYVPQRTAGRLDGPVESDLDHAIVFESAMTPDLAQKLYATLQGGWVLREGASMPCVVSVTQTHGWLYE